MYCFSLLAGAAVGGGLACCSGCGSPAGVAVPWARMAGGGRSRCRGGSGCDGTPERQPVCIRYLHPDGFKYNNSTRSALHQAVTQSPSKNRVTPRPILHIERWCLIALVGLREPQQKLIISCIFDVPLQARRRQRWWAQRRWQPACAAGRRCWRSTTRRRS